MSQQKFEEILKSIKEKKRIARDISTMHRDSLQNNPEYVKVVDAYKLQAEKKKSIEKKAELEHSKELEKLDSIKAEIKGLEQTLSDIIIKELINGKMIEIQDEQGNKYMPIVKAKYRKI